MPEGPSLFKWCTMIKQFLGRKITRIAGSSKTVDKMKWTGSFLDDVRVYGKQLFLHLTHMDHGGESMDSDIDEDVWIRCHFLMWGSIRVNEFNCKPSKTNNFPEPRLVLYFGKDEFLVFYGGSLKEQNEPPEDLSQSDILSDSFDRCKAVDHILQNHPICCILLDQSKFTGLGNIIKNEVLFSTGTHPMQVGSYLSRAKAVSIVDTVVTFSKRWLSWKMEEKPSGKFGDWTEIYKKVMCPNGHKTTKSMFGPTGMERITYWCAKCQPMRNDNQPFQNRARRLEPENSTGSESETSLARTSETTNPESKKLLTRRNESCPGVHEFKQEFPTTTNMKDIKDDVSTVQEMCPTDESCVLKSEETKLFPPESLEKELKIPKTAQNKIHNPSPQSTKEPRQDFLVAKKIKLEHVESEESCNCDDLLEDRPEQLVSTPQPYSSCNITNLYDHYQQCDEEDSTRISVSISTINVLMGSHVRVKKLKL